MPRLNITIGPVPIYLIDACLFGAIWTGGLNRFRHLGKAPNSGFVLAILCLALFSEIFAVIFTGAYVETVYMSGRMCMAVSLFFLLNNLVYDEYSLQAVLKSALLGLLVTTFLMAMTSLPGTRGLVAWLFRIDMLSPVGEDFFRATQNLQRGTRGQSLVGYNIISGWFVCLLWPLAIAFFRSEWAVGIWRKLALLACLFAPFGVLFAYSRGALLGLLLVTAALILLGEGRLKAQIATAILVVCGIIGFWGWDSDIFYFERIERRTRATLENPFGNEMERERFESYIAPFRLVADQPILLFAGEGLTIDRLRKRGYYISGSPIELGNVNIPDHSVFALGTIKYGMIAAFCYWGLLGFSILKAYGEAAAADTRSQLTRFLPQLVFAAAFAMTAWVAFDKGIIQQPRGAMMFFLIAGMVGVCQNLRAHAYYMDSIEEELEEENESPEKEA